MVLWDYKVIAIKYNSREYWPLGLLLNHPYKSYILYRRNVVKVLAKTNIEKGIHLFFYNKNKKFNHELGIVVFSLMYSIHKKS